MARQYVISTGSTALTTTVAKTLIEIPTGSSIGLDVIGLEFGCSATATGSIVVEWGTFATTGTGTTVTAVSYGKAQGTAILGTVKINDSAEPGTFAAAGLPSWVIGLPGAQYSVLLPFAREMYQPVSVNRCVRLTWTGTGTCDAHLNLFIEQ